MPRKNTRYEPDLKTIDGCETAVNHYIGLIKTRLDRIPARNLRLEAWQFVVNAMAFIDGVVSWGAVPVRVIGAELIKVIQGLNQRYYSWIDRDKKGQF